MAKPQPRTGDGYTGGEKPTFRGLFMRRSAKDNVGLPSDVQDTATAKFRKAIGDETPKPRSRWFR